MPPLDRVRLLSFAGIASAEGVEGEVGSMPAPARPSASSSSALPIPVVSETEEDGEERW